MVPILQTKIDAERVTLWSRQNPVPLRALWITNTSNLTLDRGSFSIVEDGNFGGEGLLDPIHPAEKRLLSYAVDQAIRVSTESQHNTTESPPSPRPRVSSSCATSRPPRLPTSSTTPLPAAAPSSSSIPSARAMSSTPTPSRSRPRPRSIATVSSPDLARPSACTSAKPTLAQPPISSPTSTTTCSP